MGAAGEVVPSLLKWVEEGRGSAPWRPPVMKERPSGRAAEQAAGEEMWRGAEGLPASADVAEATPRRQRQCQIVGMTEVP